MRQGEWGAKIGEERFYRDNSEVSSVDFCLLSKLPNLFLCFLSVLEPVIRSLLTDSKLNCLKFPPQISELLLPATFESILTMIVIYQKLGLFCYTEKLHMNMKKRESEDREKNTKKRTFNIQKYGTFTKR